MDVSALSLIVAALAVVIGPMVSWAIAERQIRSSLEASNKQITAPMRQAWINQLRELLAELASKTMHVDLDLEGKIDEEFQRMTRLEARILLMLNANEPDHQRLEVLMESMMDRLIKGSLGTDPDFHAEVMALSRKILKTEWDRVKEPIDAPSVVVY